MDRKLVALALVSLAAPNLHAMYSPALGTFINRDPGLSPGPDGRPVRPDVMMRGTVIQRDGLVPTPYAGRGYQDGMSLYRAYFAPNKLDPFGLSVESDAWTQQQGSAQGAFNFWSGFLNLTTNDGGMTDECRSKWLCLIRVVSWVESRHGTAGANQPGRDPMQSGNPNDQWYQTLVSGKPGGDRIIGGPGTPNHWAGNIVGDLPPAQSGMNPPATGHSDASFTPAMSYFWGTLYLIHRVNTALNAKSYKCGECDYSKMLDEAVRYNGGGDPQYGAKLQAASRQIGCAK